MECKMIEVESYVGTVLKQEHTLQNSNTLVVLLPGVGYTVYGPALYYPYSVAVELGYDVLMIEYGFQKMNQFLRDEDLDSVVAECKLALERALLEKTYDHLVFIGKSFGTRIISEIVEEYKMRMTIIPIFITPMKAVKELIVKTRCLVIVGTDDPFWESSDTEEISRVNDVQLYTIEGANHNLEVGNFIESIEYMKQCNIKIRDFMLNSVNKH